ncbi:phage portal protein [Microbacterium esteraromaticum]|uniref:phage portal protein n=1 Tax=Microbacterium esteraromaticum TaxID=57043 RepID=UPI002368C156|nr:phage portal protein [Microbacterium esteraromaticum]WDH77922.1 phage portal protein [Microbacterium esteraromaticum]
MPLPTGNVTWPPAEFKDYFDMLAVFDGWYVGDIAGLTEKYQSQPITHAAQYNGGLVGFGARAWLGKPPRQGESRARLHIPLAPDIATLSADYLFSEAPRVVLPGERSENGNTPRDRMQDRAEKVINTPAFHSLLLEAGEVASALGGTYLRLVWDTENLKAVRAEAVHADAAIPTFRYGQLHEVTFWSEIAEDDGKVWRHLEHHSHGLIEHGLFEGTKGKLGRRVPVTERPETKWLAPLLANESSALATGVEGLTAAYVPNMRPNKLFRKKPHLAPLGISDFTDIVQLFDAVDEVWSSWMRDIRIAKARIVVAKQYLEAGASFGSGASFDYDREVYEGMATLTGPGGQEFGFHAHQFEIRVEQHAATVKDLRDQAMRSAGWTPGSIGGSEAGLRTATEIKSDDRLSERTRDKKINYWKTLAPFFLTWLQLDAELYGGEKPKDEPEFRFPAEAQADQEAMSRTNQMLFASQSASIETRVRLQHPEWDGPTVNTEVDKIKAEFGVGASADPTKVGAVHDATDPSSEDVARMRDRMAREAAGETPEEP